MKCPLLIECLKTRALEWIEENSTDDWQYKVASDKKLLYPYTSFSAALLAYLRLLVRHPIAKILFVLEKLSVTKSFISINQTRKNQDLIPFLKTIFFDPKILNINDLPEPKPDHYVMPELFYDLKFPFSYYFMKKINDFKTAWGDELEKLKENPDNCDDDELSHDAFENAVQGFSENVKTSLPAINDQVFRDFSEWFFDDFVTVMVANDADKKDSELLAKLVQLYIGKDKAFDPVLLHIYWWKHSNVISADLQLAQMCPSVINEFMREGPDVSFEEFLVDKVIKMMLDKFAKKGSEPQLDQWQHEVVKVLSFSAKILKTNKLRSYQLLRICNDIVSSKLIPLPNIKEIIKLGLDSDEQNVLSKKFVDHVLGILSKLEKNEQNLSLQRSFIMRCLDTIPLDSVVRQHIYNNIFSQKDPFPLMGSIIGKIFWKEEDAINEPFLRILQDSKEILQASPRLKVINSALKNNNLDSSMATLCCDIIQKELFVDMNIPEVARYFRHAVQTLLEKTFEPLKRISAIAFLKEFVYCMWYQTLQDDYTQPISFIGIMDVGEFDGDLLIEEINNFLSVDNPLIHSLKVYFLQEGISSTAPSQYSIRSLTLNQARIDNVIIYDQEELSGIHMFSQRNLGIGRGLDVIYDLQKIEIELARQLVFEKVYIDTVGETSLYLPPFSYHLELIQVSTRIIGDIRGLIPQEQIPPEQAELMGFLQTEKQKVTDPLYLYICEPSLHFWPPAISELEDLDESFPDSLCVNQAFEAYKFVMDQIEYHKQMVSSREQQIQNQLTNPEANRLPPAPPGSQRGSTSKKKKSRFDML
ncbi:9728_t:CDS:2 [Gigaspora rosea]|nr:9728_t:CDS:2 [Gigaspora rosea]